MEEGDGNHEIVHSFKTAQRHNHDLEVRYDVQTDNERSKRNRHGVLAGVTVAAISTKAMAGGHRKASHMKKNAGKAMHTVGNLIGDVEKMLR